MEIGANSVTYLGRRFLKHVLSSIYNGFQYISM